MRVLTCPACGSEQTAAESLLGTLGTLEHHRCRYCGMGFSRNRRARPKVRSRRAPCESCEWAAIVGRQTCDDCGAHVVRERAERKA